MSATRFACWCDHAPRVVAESLLTVRDPLRGVLDPGERRDPAGVAAAIAGAAIPSAAPDTPPSWLRAEQVPSFRRALQAVRSFGGALLADPVGSGKTYVALAVCHRLGSGTVPDVVAPAILRDTWHRVADTLGLSIRFTSHEGVSRGEAPSGSGAVIIDESHRFRTATSRRYRVLAPALVGRPVLLVSATPVVNRVGDLAHQLLLGIRDDALRLHGVPSLRSALQGRRTSPALAAIVIAEPPATGGLPACRTLAISDWLGEDPASRGMLRRLDRLELSRDPGIAALVRTSFLRALGSSPAALRAALRRYALLLEHAHSAQRAGRRVSRRDVEREVGRLPDQLVMWELVDDPAAPAELSLGDRPRLVQLDRHLTRRLDGLDPKVELLRAALADGAPTVVFSSWIDTVDYLRRRLAFPGTAWVAGARAGVGGLRYPRRSVLSAFDPKATPVLPAGPMPWLLLASDLAAEGLNLHRAARVVHYDLPWTQVRIDQRDGRARRLGSVHPEVAVIRFDLPAALEERLRLAERLEHKARLPAAVGLGAGVTGAWAWHRALRTRWQDEPAWPGWAVVPAAEDGAVVGFRLESEGHAPVGITLASDATGRWSDDPTTVAARLEAARSARGSVSDGSTHLGRLLDRLAPAVRGYLRIANGGRWVAANRVALLASIRLAQRRLAQARRDRRAADEHLADRVLAALSGGLTAGEEHLAAALSRGEAHAWARLAAIGTARAEVDLAVRVRLVGIIVFAATPAAA